MMNADSPLSYESKFLKFDSLMQFKVKHILLVASPYDSYILEEDGQLTDLIYNEYLELNLTITPNVRRASNEHDALQMLEEHEFDMVLIFKRVSDIDVYSFGREVKKKLPDLPVIFLAYHQREIEALAEGEHKDVIDHTFVWTGDVKILLSIIKLVEDHLNVDHDTEAVGVRVIIIVEDSVKFYSTYLPQLYREIMQQTRELIAEGVNLSDKILRMRARPKILLARDYEEGWELFQNYRKYVLAVITDFRFKINGVHEDEAGVKLVKRMREKFPELPVLMQSSDDHNREIAFQNNLGFISKRSPKLNTELRNFIMTNFGFGEFVFTDPDNGKILAIASDFISMERCLEKVDEKSLLYHANRNHFSNWLMARTEFDLAERLRPRKVSEFKDAATLRQYLIETFRRFRFEKQKGEISDFSQKHFDVRSEFVRIGSGSLGGKGRGLAFINALISRYNLHERFHPVRLSVPPTVILGTDIFDEFMERNKLLEAALRDEPDEALVRLFLKARFSRGLQNDLDALLETFVYPLAVRSSSMLEDSHLQNFAGIYQTYMLANNGSNARDRRRQLENAIKKIYASTYLKRAKAFHEAAGNRVEEEKMAVIIQKAIGQQYHERFYPGFSGVALSFNYYSLDDIAPDDGVVYTALGFGKTIVDGMNCLRFSPSYPDKLPQFSTVKDMLKNAQRDFFAIDLSQRIAKANHITVDGLTRYNLEDAEKDGSLLPICSTYSRENDRIYVGSSRPGTRIITFAPVLKSKTFPLTEIVKFLLRLGSQGLNCPVEIEFAVNLPEPSHPDPGDFYFLQIRPMIKEAHNEVVELDQIPVKRVIARSEKTLGNMRRTDISDVVLIKPAFFFPDKTIEIAAQVGQFNGRLAQEKRPYLLIGPGRWGTTERWLGIPVTWNQISGAKVIIEAAYGNFAPEPSFGTHFFQNLTAFQTGYLTVNPGHNNGFVNLEWLEKQTVIEETEYISHVRLPKGLEILIDGRVGKGLVAAGE